ncbi:S1 RNA-binding domain-containing protein [Streptomyces sp. VRA16 Mangrove soil]|uniref:S1 RNA-binding domain-containing protein n=1 Tax=Streptomyces sp. VRA16 Mangrove soil TaxID=2817434 RepID=UPI001A9FC572|nr:S1 RNA-binding domain-containing protein [Streptomyces sp. VRA16 Mangrove soil]MBO1331587.1 S1 RNA-binding domain-containing protein [Streptomyces sp. VRA16 Mangrove soil]
MSSEATRPFLTGITAGDLVTTTVCGLDDHDVLVRLDGDRAEEVLGRISAHELSWHRIDDVPAFAVSGRRLTAEVLGVDRDKGVAHLSSKRCEYPEHRDYVRQVEPGSRLHGSIASVESFGVFVRLNGEVPHPVFPATGFIRIPDLSWTHFDRAEDVVRPGQRVHVEVVGPDRSNGEVVVSLRALKEDPLIRFADRTGETVRGRVTKIVPFGVFVRVSDEGVEGLVHASALTGFPGEGDTLHVRIDEVDLARRRVRLSLASAP